MRLYIDGNHLGHAIPSNITWQTGPKLGNAGDGAPVFAPLWICRLRFQYLASAQFEAYIDVIDGEKHTFHIPHRTTGILTEYEAFVEPFTTRADVRDDCIIGYENVEILLTGIEV